MSDLVIRRYEVGDKRHVKNLHVIASTHSEVGYKSGPWEQDLDDVEEFYLKDGEFLVGLIGTKILAMGGYKLLSNGIGDIRRIRVHPSHRRSGYARQILNQLEVSAKAKKVKTLELHTTILQKMAQQFYEKNGYKKYDEKTITVGDKMFQTVYYKKTL